MKRYYHFILTGLAGLIIIGLLVYFSSEDEKKTYAWNETYKADSDQPYGGKFIKELLREHHPDGEFIERTKGSLEDILASENLQTGTDYVFIGESLFLTKRDETALMDFIEKGNSAFISAREVPEFADYLYESECTEGITLDDNRTRSTTLNFYHPSLKDEYGYTFSYKIRSTEYVYNWEHFSNDLFCDSTVTIVPLGYQDNGSVNFLRIPYGKGSLYLHSNPITFSNYSIVQQNKMEYASAALSHLQGRNVIWEELGKMPIVNRDGDDSFNNPLYFLMEQPSLRYGWWMIVASVILYVLFAAKRTQRVIPVLERKANTSLEFVKMVSSLHYQNPNHIGMAKKKMKYFYYFIRSRYGINGQQNTPETIQRLSDKSKVPLQDVQAVFKFYKLVETGSNGFIDGIRLGNFYRVIENFYKQCK